MNWLNITSLTLGLTVFFLISLFLYQESSYEKDFERRHDIYQVGTHFYNLGDLAWTSRNLELVLDQVSGVDAFTQFDNRSVKVEANNKEFETVRTLVADSSFFKVFDFELIFGQPELVLKQPHLAVINEGFATKIFGRADIVGESLDLMGETYIINGVSKSPQFKTQLNFDLVVTKDYMKGIQDDLWGSISSYTYLLAGPNVTMASINTQLESIGERYIYKEYQKKNEDMPSFQDWKEKSTYLGYFAEPLLGLRSDSKTKNLMMPHLNVAQFNVLTIVGLAALLISIINFINISTAKASVRTGEVAVKRVLGSSRKWLIFQFISESFFQVLLASLASLALVEGLVKLSPGFLEGMVDYSVLHSTELVIGILIFVVLLTFSSGIYPALYLSSGRSINLLRGSAGKALSLFNAASFRRSATVAQFVLAIVLIAGVITMFQQLNHLDTRDLGYESGNVFILENTSLLRESTEAFRQELSRKSGVVGATFADHFPNQSGITVLDFMVKDEAGNEHPFIRYRTDPAFFEVMQMDFVAGGSFGTAPKKESSNGEAALYPVILNETAVKAMGIEDPLGKVIDNNRQIVGVINDFVFSDLRQGISPVMISQRGQEPYYKMAVRMAPGNFDIETIKEVWSQFSDKPLRWYEFSSNYEKLLEEEAKTFQAILTFSIFTVIISCMGLLGLAVFTIDQRIKEFGIRKVLGASIMDIMGLYSWDFVKLILLALVLAVPIAVYGLNLWLNDFADRVSLSPLVFLLTAGITLIIVLSTLLLQSLKAGRLNPVETLRNE